MVTSCNRAFTPQRRRLKTSFTSGRRASRCLPVADPRLGGPNDSMDARYLADCRRCSVISGPAVSIKRSITPEYLVCLDPPVNRGEAESSGPAPTQHDYSSSGTGFFVAPQHVLTNDHVIKDCGRSPIWVSYPDRRPERAFISGQDDTNDLALLRTDLPNMAVASFRFGPRVGEAVAAYGFPLSGLPWLTLSRPTTSHCR